MHRFWGLERRHLCGGGGIILPVGLLFVRAYYMSGIGQSAIDKPKINSIILTSNKGNTENEEGDLII